MLNIIRLNGHSKLKPIFKKNIKVAFGVLLIILIFSVFMLRENQIKSSKAFSFAQNHIIKKYNLMNSESLELVEYQLSKSLNASNHSSYYFRFQLSGDKYVDVSVNEEHSTGNLILNPE